MANMTISEGDKYKLRQFNREFPKRKRQLVPWPFTTDQTERLYLNDVQYKLTRALDNQTEGDPNAAFSGSFLNRETVVTVVFPREWLPGDADRRAVSITTRTGNWPALVAPRSFRARQNVDENGPNVQVLRHWVQSAWELEWEARSVEGALNSMVNSSTTFKQIHKAYKDYFRALSSWLAHSTHSYRDRNIDKLKEVCMELESEGSKGARTLSEETQRVLAENGPLVSRVLAECLLLPDCADLGPDSPYRETWLN